MLSFPSSFSRNQLADDKSLFTKIKKISGANAKETLNNLAKTGLNALKKNNNTGLTLDDVSDGLDFNTNRDYQYNNDIKKYNISSNFILTTSVSNNQNISKRIYSVNLSNLGTHSNKRNMYENVFKIPASILMTMNRYNYIFKKSAFSFAEVQKNGSKDTVNSMVGTSMVSPSLFNPWYGIPVQGFSSSSSSESGKFPLNIPIYIDGIPVNYNDISTYKDLIDPKIKETIKNNFDNDTTYLAKKSTDTEQEFRFASYNTSLYETISADLSSDINDCSIKKLVELSNSENTEHKYPLGRNTFRYADFMYCKHLGKVSNNHLITLRKFNTPIGDNINDIGYVGDDKLPTILPDKGRLISWFGTDDNKLEDICKYHYEASWREINSELQDVNSKEENHGDKFFPSIANITSDDFIKLYSKGAVQGNNMFINYFIGNNPGPYANDSDYWFKDPNKIYEPINTTRQTHIYEGNLKFQQEFTLKFSYTLRYYNGINPKSAFLDLLGNILEVTYKRGKYWGGGVRWLGPSPNNIAWKEINDLTNKMENLTGEGLNALFGCSNFDDLANLFGNALQSLGDFVSDFLNNAVDIVSDGLENITNNDVKRKKLADKGAALIAGNIKNKLGRPAVYAIKKIHTGEPVGLWHLTVGNPRNPILSIGNLILTGADIQHSGPLGLDDFPTELSVTVNLKHAKPRDITEISQMYTKGTVGIYTELANRNLKAFFGDSLQSSLENGIYKNEPISKAIDAFKDY